MKRFIGSGNLVAALCAVLFAGTSIAQTGALRGSSTIFSNGTNTITFMPPAGLLESYSITLPTAQSGAGTFLNVNNGAMTWGTPVPDAAGSGGGPDPAAHT